MKDYIFVQKAAGIKGPPELKKIKGRKRRKFRNNMIKEKYDEIYKSLNYLNKLKRKRTKILSTLMFFCLSTYPNEDVLSRKEYFIKLSDIYHERWGIENGFKEDKSKFVQSSRSRKSTRRQWNLALGMILYNRWRVSRMRMMLEKEREKFWNNVPWEPRSPFIRRKFERQSGGMLSGERYLLQLLQYGLNMRINKILKD